MCYSDFGFAERHDTVFRREIGSQRQWGYGTCYMVIVSPLRRSVQNRRGHLTDLFTPSYLVDKQYALALDQDKLFSGVLKVHMHAANTQHMVSDVDPPDEMVIQC